MKKKNNIGFKKILLLLSFLLFGSSSVSAHCDGLDGPVVKTAIKAIETGNVNYVLMWVQKADEEIIKNAFKKTLVVRKLNKEAQELADMYFYEIVVRVHRSGIEHEKLHTILAEATKVEGEIGMAAKEVAKVLHGHFVKEEEIAIPPLGLLTEIIKGHVSEDMKSIIKMTDKLKAELPQMLEEHKMIVEALNKFKELAEKMNRKDYLDFTEDLKLHAKTEEEVTYPAAILIGEYLKLKLRA